MSGADIIHAKTTRLKLVSRKKIAEWREPEAETLRFYTDPQVEVRYEARVQRNFMEVKGRNININANRQL